MADFQHTAARRRLVSSWFCPFRIIRVSTHSRPKAAGRILYLTFYFIFCFNTQPPEGGWQWHDDKGNWASIVSTHSRPKAAGQAEAKGCTVVVQFQHTAARRRLDYIRANGHITSLVSTHSRPKAAGLVRPIPKLRNVRFQHTAARRRLEPLLKALLHQVSQP